MKKSTKAVVISLAVFVILAVLIVILNNVAESQLRQGLEDAFSQNKIEYEKIDVSILDRKAGVEHPEFNFQGKRFAADELSVDDISIFEYLFNKKIEIGELFLKNPALKINKSEKSDSGGGDSGKDFKEDILIKNINIENGKVTMSENDSASIYGEFTSLRLQDFHLNNETMQETPPFTYGGYEFKGDSLFIQMDPRHHFTTGEIDIKNGATTLKDIRIIPLYNKVEFQQHIPHELDRIDLKGIDEVNLSNIQWEMKNDSLYFRNSLTEINNAHLEVYRDKLQEEDTRHKKMYSQMFRDLPVKLKLDTVRVNNAYIQYEENVAEDREPGVVDFENLNASIYNLSNIEMNKADFSRTEVDVKADFMDEAAVEVNWIFDISDRNDNFKISGNMDMLSASAMNRMLQPAMNVKADGNIDDMTFDYAGNRNKAQGDVSLYYDNFKVEVLESDGSEKNEVLSSVANLIINNEAKSEDVEQKDLEVERKKNRSFWNYLWLMVRQGALKSFF